MTVMHGIKPSFSGGEVAPSVYARVDLAKYSTWCKTLKNFIVHPHGGVSNDPGTHYVATAKYDNKAIRLHQFEFSSTQTYMIEFGHYYARFYTNGGQILKSSPDAWVTSHSYVVGDFVTQSSTTYYCVTAHTSGTFATDLSNGKWVAQSIYEVPMPYQESDLPKLTFTQSADVLFIFHPNYQTRLLSRTGNSAWTVTLYDFKYGPFMLPNADKTYTITPSATTGSITLTASKATFYSTHIGSLWQFKHNIPEQSVVFSISGTTNNTYSSNVSCGGTWRFSTTGSWVGTIYLYKSTDGGSTWTQMRSFTNWNSTNFSTYGTEDMSNNAEPFLLRMYLTGCTWIEGTPSATLSGDHYIQTGVAKVTSYTSSTAVTATVMKSIGLASATFEWAEGSWSDYRGWPSVGEFYQDRLITGCTLAEQQTTWMTKTGDYYDYSRSTPLVDSDGISINLPARQLNGINGFVPLTGLIALTSASEWTIGTPNQALTPTSVSQRPNGFTGSNGLKPVVIKNRAIFVQAMGAFLQDMGYDLYSDSFTGADLSVLANHLFTGYTITDMAYQQYPDNLVWCVRSDGKLLSMTYMREQEVLAWSWHETNGSYESIAVIPASGYNQLWVSVKRGTKRYIEYLDHRMVSTAPADQFFVHSGIIYSGTPADTITGLSHLEGMEVAVLADGNVVANATNPMTVTSGQITLPIAASKVIVGLPYTSDLETLNVDTNLADGTMQGRKVRISKVVVRVLNSRGGWMGPDFDNLTEIADNFRTTYDTAIDLYTGDLKHTMGPGYQDGGRMCIRQVDPLPFTCLALMPLITAGGTTGT